MSRAHATESLLAVSGAVVAAWPLAALLRKGPFLALLVGAALLISVTGIVARAAGATRVVPLLQAAWLPVIAAAFILPGTGSRVGAVMHAVTLVQGATHELATEAAPLAPGPGLQLLLTLAVPVVVTTVDYLAVARRNPTLAGIPLLGLLLASAFTDTGDLGPVYVVLTVVVWLTMVALGTSLRRHSWASQGANRVAILGSEPRGQAPTAWALTVIALAVALVVPTVVPHRTPLTLPGGPGRSATVRSGTGTASILGTEADIADDLTTQGSQTVLSFRTDDPSPPLLQVLATGVYRDGRWDLNPPPGHLVAGSNGTRLPIPGRAAGVRTTTYTLRVTHNTLRPPQLAVPYPTTGVDLPGTGWSDQPSTGRIVPDDPVSGYTVTFDRLTATRQPDGTAGTPPGPADLGLPPAAAARVRRLAALIGGRGPLGEADAIQAYLRGPAFRYSLTLAPRRRGPDGAPLDPLSNFLVTKVGYCTQFATAMVMLARADGIPARFAVGFLPGTRQSDGSYRVVRSDAHAWPQLWLPGLGWTGYEPTPGGPGAGRANVVPQQALVAAGVPAQQHRASPAPQIRPPLPQAAQAGPPATPEGHRPVLPPALGWALLAAAIAAALAAALLLPLLAGVQRRRLLRSAPDRVEAEWTVLRGRLEDLGIAAPAGLSPRAIEAHYRRRLQPIDDAGRRALRTAAQTLEDTRYAAPGGVTRSIDADAARILRRARRGAPVRRRVAAALWPRTARHAVAAGMRAAARRFGGRRAR